MENLELLKLQDAEAVKNTFYRSPKVSPAIIHNGTYITVKTINNETNIYKLEEIVLGIIADFKFAPYWLIQQWFEDFNRNDSFTKVSEWLSVGLVWIDSNALGLFIRPTKFLLDMYKIEDQSFVDISFGKLNHTCSEEQIIFDVQSGNPNSEFWQIIKTEDTLLPCYHPLEIEVENDEGTIAIRESNFSVNRYKPKEIIQKDEDLAREIKSGERYTSEFADFSLFPIVGVDKNNSLVTKIPDVIVPVPRNNMLPQSYAIEIELTSKLPEKYTEIMLLYKDNIKFGKVFYLCGTARIARLIKEAFKEVNGLGNCQLYIIPFVSPAIKLISYSTSDKQEQTSLIDIFTNIDAIDRDEEVQDE